MPDAFEWVVGYPALVVVCFLSGIAIPMPEDVAQVAAGTQIASGRLDWLPTIAAVAVGVFARDALFFATGRWLGGRALDHPWARRLIGEARLTAARDRVRSQGAVAVLIGRFSVGIRTSTFFVAGALGVRPRDFALWDGLALTVSAPLLLGVGYAFGEPMIALAQLAVDRAAWTVAALAVLAPLAWWLASSRQPEATGP